MYDEYNRRIWDPSDDISPAQTEFATSLRIPLLTSAYPRSSYITGIVIRDEGIGQGIEPTDDEVAAVATRLKEYCDYWYRDSFKRKMERFAPFDIDSGANLGYFTKREDGGWAYRKRTWNRGPSWIPTFDSPIETIQQVIGRTQNLSM